jgi:hypothetical protein
VIDPSGAPRALVLDGDRLDVVDEPTALEDLLLVGMTHPPRVTGWRFSAARADSPHSDVFDVVSVENGWRIANVWR